LKIFLILVMTFILAGCSSWPKQVKDSDFLTKHVSANVPVDRAYTNLQQGFRYCGVAQYGFPEWRNPEKDGTVLCDVYPDKTSSGKPDKVSGTIKLSPAPTGTQAVLKVRRNVSNYEDMLTAWEIFMSGRVREACP